MMKINGFIRPIDCFIHLKIPVEIDETLSVEENLKRNNIWKSTYFHELTHYIQLITSPVGYFLRIRNQWLCGDILQLLRNLPKPIKLGFYDKNFESNTFFEKHLNNRIQELSIFNTHFFRREIIEVYNYCFPNLSGDKYQYLVQKRPLDISISNNSFYVRNSSVQVPITANVIMEYMARLAQLIVDNKFINQHVFFQRC